MRACVHLPRACMCPLQESRGHRQLNHLLHAAPSALTFLLASHCQPLHLSNQPIGPFGPAQVCNHYAVGGHAKDSGYNVWSESRAGHIVSAFGFCAVACLQTRSPTSSYNRIICWTITSPVVCCNFSNEFDLVRVCKGVEAQVQLFSLQGFLFLHLLCRGKKKRNNNKNTTQNNRKKVL